MKKTVFEIIESIELQQENLLAKPTSIKQNKNRAKTLGYLKTLLNYNSKWFNELEVENASKQSATFNVGVMLEPLLRKAITNEIDSNKKMSKIDDLYCDGMTKNGGLIECKTLVNNEPSPIAHDRANVYVLVIKATCKGVYKLSTKTIRENGLVGRKLSLDDVLTYGKLSEPLSKKIGVNLL